VSDSDPQDVPFAEFIDDYFVECDEHLGVARNNLLALESFVGQAQPDRSLLDELLRSFHSVKGLSAMVGVREAEQIAHQMESYLSALRKGQASLSAGGLEVLITGVRILEEVIAARRGQGPPPDISPLLAELADLLPGGNANGGSSANPTPLAAPEGGPLDLSPEKSRLLAAALAAGNRAWRVTFIPSPALAERGVNVNTVRRRLQEIGELIHAAPLVLPGGQITFAFVVAAGGGETAFAALQEDGMSYVLENAPPATKARGRDGAESPAPLAAPSGPPLMPSNVVRVDLTRLDDLMRMVGELVINRARLDDNLKRLASALPASEWRVLQETNQAFERQLRDLREGVMCVRLVPVREVFTRMQFVVRDLTREFGKKVRLTPSGQETEIDKFLVERMMDPLLHLVRNAVSHGLESPDDRVAKGKPPEGEIALRASTTGEMILIEVEDDGRGIDTEAVLARARLAGLTGAETATDTAALLDLLCAPGFSTRDEADRASGRGVGMAVVRTVVEELGGSLTLDTRAGRGTRFAIQLPLTLAIADALIVAVGGQTFAVPLVAVREVIQVECSAPKAVENNELIPYRDGVLPLVRLGAVFGLVEQPARSFYALVAGGGPAAVGIAVERVLGLREIVVRPLTDPLVRVPGIAGATELGDGRVVLILDPMPLARAVRRQAHDERGRPGPLVSAVLPPCSTLV
jgi:two-component system, chemotaxis family, sensor kinase CheA